VRNDGDGDIHKFLCMRMILIIDPYSIPPVAKVHRFVARSMKLFDFLSSY